MTCDTQQDEEAPGQRRTAWERGKSLGVGEEAPLKDVASELSLKGSVGWWWVGVSTEQDRTQPWVGGGRRGKLRAECVGPEL